MLFGLLASCSTTTPDPLTPGGSQLDGTRWRLRAVYRYRLPDVLIDDSAVTHYTLRFGANSTVSGIGDCNQFSGTYTTGLEDTLYMTNLVSTEIGCPDQAGEQAYFDGLSKAIAYQLDSDELLMYCASDDIWAMYFYRF